MKKREFLILAIVLIVVMLGFGMVIPIFPFYIEELGAGGSELGLLVATSAFLEFIFGPMWGSVSDRFGRKPILLVGLFGYAISTFLFGISTALWMLFAARAVSGILSSATITAAMAYVTDITTAENRGDGMGKIGAAMALGLMLGPGLGGWLATESLSRPFFIAAGLSLLSLVMVAVILPESISKEDRVTSIKPQVLQFEALRKALFSQIGVLLLLVTLFSFALTNFEAIFGLYALDKFGFTPNQVGTILMVVAIVSTAGKASLTGPVTRKWGEAVTIKFSLIAGAVGFLILLAAWDFYSILVTTGLFILSKTLLRPAAFALISNQAEKDQGAVMGLSNSFMSLGRIIGPIWAGFVFDLDPNYPYLSGSIFMLVGFIISLFTVKAQKVQSQL